MGFESVAKKRMQEAGYVEGSNKIKSEPKQTQTTNSNKNNTAASTPLGQLVENSKYTPQARVKQLLSNPQPQPTKTETKVKQIFLKPTNSAAAATPLGQEYVKSLTNLENMMKTQTPKAEKNKSGDVVKYFGEVIYETFKNSAKSIGNGILDIISMQQNQSKYDPVLLAAESTGLVKSGYGEAYGNIVDKQTKTITENIKKSAINQAKNMENIQNKYSPLLSKGVLKAGEYASEIGQMATMMIPYVGTTLLALQAYGGGVQEGLLDGTDIHSARMLGGAEAIKEVAIEKLFGGIPLTKGIADDIINSIGSKLFTNKFSKGLYKMAINGIGEGLEEDFSAILTPYIKRAIYDKNAPTVTFDELKDNFMGGFVPSLILGGGANVLSAKTYLDLNNKIDAYNELVVKTDSKDKLKLLDKKTTTLDEYNDAIKDLFVTSEKSKIDAEKTATQAEINWLKKEIDGVTGLKLTNEEKNTIVAELTKKIAADENYLLDLNEQKNYIAQVEKGKAELRLPAEEIPYNKLNPTHIDIAKGIESPKGYVNVREVDGNRFVVTNAFGEEVIKTQDELNTRYISKESDPVAKKMIDTVITAATSTPKASSSAAKGFFVGDVYTNNKTGQSYKVIESNDTETIMENEKGERRRFANNIISSMAKSGLYTKTFAGDETIEKTDTGESSVGDIITDSFTLSPVTRADNNKQVWVLSPNKSLSSDEISTVFKKSKAKYVESLVTADGDAVDGYVFNKKPSLETIDAMNKLLGTTEKAISTTEKAIPTTEKSSATVEKSKTTSKTFPKISLNERLVETVRKTISPNVLMDSGIVELLKNKFGENYIDVLAQDILATYERDGDIGEHEALFSDGGQAIYNLIEGVDEETSVDADEETKTEEKPVKTTKKETAEETEKSTKTKKISEEKTIENELEKDNESFASDTKKPLQKESSSDTMEEKIIDKTEKRKADSNEERRNDLLHDNSRRGNDGDTGKQARQIQGFERKKQGKDATERRKFGRELIKSGQVEKVNDGKHEYTLVKPEAYNEDMQSMVDEAKKNGRELSFFIGTATVTKDDGSTFQADGIRFGGTNRIAVQYDGDKVPQKIAKHETIHSKWLTPKVQKIAKKILTSLSEADRQKIAELNRYEYYKEIFEEEIANGEVDIVWEEFVCDVMSGMNDYTVNYIDDVNTYWYGNKEALGYDAASYPTSSDAGGNKYSVAEAESDTTKLSESGDINESTNSSGMAERGTYQNNDSIWKRSDDSEEIYKSMGSSKKDLRRSENSGYRYIDWSRIFGDIDVYESAEKKYAYGVLRKISKLNVASVDQQGRAVSNEQKEYFKDTVAKNSNGELIPLYHATDYEFTVFTMGDFAYHIGDIAQAIDIGKKYIKEVYIRLKNPVFIEYDAGIWRGSDIADALIEQGIITKEQYDELSMLDGFDDNDSNSVANKAIKELLQKKRYDGIVYRNDYETKGLSFMVFDSNQIKYTSNRTPTKSADNRYSIAEDSYAPTFYSHMGKTIDEMKQDKIGANSVVNYLTGKGVKAEEIKWSGIEEFLEGKKSVTKAELQEFVASNQLEIEETVLSEEEASNFKYDYTNFERSQLNALEENLEESWGEIDSAWQEMFGEEIAWDIRYNDNATRMVKQELNKRFGDNKDSRYEQIVSSLKDVELWESQRVQIVAKAKERTKEVVAPKWSEYKLEGGDNYREITFKMPDSDYSNQAMRTHWGEDAKGILAHARVQDFDVDGKKMLFIEEIQSDWHNEGHKKGYSAKIQDSRVEEAKRIHDMMNEPGIEFDKFTNLRESFEELQFELEMEGINIQDYINDNVPDAPFRNNYHEYVLKRLIRMAAEEGYDSIGWTTADIQSDRYSADYAEGYRIEYDQDIPKFLNKYGKKWGAKVGKTEIGKEDGGWYEVEGTIVWSMPITDSMKESVLYEGQTRYSLAGENTEFWDEFLKDYIERNSSTSKKANPINDTTIYDFMGETERLQKENAKFKEEIERLKERVKLEKKLTHGKVLDERLVDKAAVHLRKMANSTISKADLTKSLNDIYSYILNESELTWDDIYNMCYGLAEVILDKSKPEVIVDDYYKQILKDIRNTRISLSDSQKNEARDVFDKNWNKYFFGDVIIANDGVDLESKWQEWSGQYPGIFEPDISDGEMISELYNTIQTLKEASETVVEYNEEERARWLANEIYNDYWNVSPIKTTADKYYDKIKQLASDHKTAMAELRESFDVKIKEQRLVDDIYYGKKLASLRTTSKEKLKDLKASEREKFEKIYNDIRERKNKEIAIAKEEGKKRLATYKDTARKQALVKRITSYSLALNEKLIKNSKDKHIPEILKDSVRNLLIAIDFSSKRLLEKGVPTKKDISLTKALGKVKDMMMKASNGYEGLTELYGHGLDEKLEELIKSADEIANAVGDNEYVLNKLSADKLETLDKMVKTISKAVNQLNKFHSVNYSKSVEEFSKETISYLDSMAKAKLFDGIKGKAQKLLEWDNALPYYVFKRYGSGGKKIYEALQDGWDKFAFNVRDILDYSNKAYSEKEIKQWSKEVREFDIKLPTDEKDSSAETQKVQMTIPQIMSMYCLNKREQARNHMYQGGIRIADIKTEKGKVISQTDGVIFTPKDVLTIVSSLSDRQKEVADTLQDFMNTVCSDWGNEVTMKRFGYKAFGEKNYFPIQSDKNNLAVNDETEQINSLFRLLNMSFTKSLDENANNRIVISDIFDVFANHTSDMAKYNALALPVLDSFKWYNYKDKENISKDTFAISSVKQSIESAFGKEGQKYFTTFLTDINGAQDVSRDTFGKGFFSNAKIAAVGANMRVVALQPTSYPRASAVLDNKYLSLALAKKPQPKMAEKYCGIALWKSLGYYDTNIQRGVQSQIKHDNTVKDKIVEISMKGAEIADKVTWGYLWTACELETKDKRKDLALGSEEFYHATAKRLREVIYATQVVDSTMTRSQMMRSTDGFDKLITAFASEPTLSYNMLQDAYMGYKLDARKIGKAKAWKNNRAKIAKISIAYVTTSALAALVESAFDKLRDDDDEDKLLRQYFLNLYSNLSIIGKIPYAKEIQSVIKGFSVSRTDAQWMEELVKGVKAWYKMFNGKGNPTSAIKYLVKGVSDLTGYPIYNIYRDTMAVLNKADVLTFDELNDIMKGSFMYGMIESEESVGFGDIKNSQPEKYKTVSEKLKNLEEKTGENLQPTEQQGYYTVDGVKYEMTEAQLKEAQEIRGEKSFELITDLFNDKKVFEDQKKYSMLNDEDKVKYIKRCYREAGEYTKEQMIEKVKASSKEKSN